MKFILCFAVIQLAEKEVTPRDCTTKVLSWDMHFLMGALSSQSLITRHVHKTTWLMHDAYMHPSLHTEQPTSSVHAVNALQFPALVDPYLTGSICATETDQCFLNVFTTAVNPMEYIVKTPAAWISMVLSSLPFSSSSSPHSLNVFHWGRWKHDPIS